MSLPFSIDVEWLGRTSGAVEIRETSASIQIAIGPHIATRLEDTWSRSVQSATRLSAYPLALWLASSWWRLRWESRPSGTPDVSWRMAHEMAGAGHGFLWPSMTFESDGEDIGVVCTPSDPLSEEPFHYLADFRRSVSASGFEEAVDGFLSLVIARLQAVGVPDSHLCELWTEVREERADLALTRYRKLEAELAFEPGEAPADVIDRLTKLSDSVGAAAAEEIASACAGPQAGLTLAAVEELAGSPGENALVALPDLCGMTSSGLPWERGASLARELRSKCGFGSGKVDSKHLADLLGIPEATLKANPQQAKRPLGLATRSGNGDRLSLRFQRRNEPGLRFEASRFIAECILAPAKDSWLSLTGAYTARQKVQRAFAAEFLCPIDGLKDFLSGDYSTAAAEEAGGYFAVSEFAVTSQLRNHQLISYAA